MPMESYNRNTENQNKSNSEFSQPQQQELATEYVYMEQPKSRKLGFGWILTFIIIAILVVAAMKNPSASETKTLIKDTLIEKINERMGAEIMNGDNDGATQFGAFLGMTLAPYLLDYFTNIHVNNYVIFSTFDCTAKIGEEMKSIVSGIVVFGKAIPLKSDLNKDTLESK